eukprot:5029488-Pleurochrysis_carterae.AAC.2
MLSVYVRSLPATADTYPHPLPPAMGKHAVLGKMGSTVSTVPKITSAASRRIMHTPAARLRGNLANSLTCCFWLGRSGTNRSDESCSVQRRLSGKVVAWAGYGLKGINVAAAGYVVEWAEWSVVVWVVVG